MTTTTTRRAMLAGTAALPALATTTALADSWTPAPDPIFDALEAYNRVQAEHRPGMSDEAIDELADRWGEAQTLVISTRPTTPAGLAALIGFARAEQIDQNRDDLAPLWATLDDATRGMSGLAPWSPPAVAAPGKDRIIAAIERHRKAMAASHAAVAVSAALHDDDPRHEAAAAATARATDELDEAGADLAAIEPTTTVGVLALLAHVIACIEEASGDGLGGDDFDGGNWRLPHMVERDDGRDEHFIYGLLQSLESTLQNLTGRA